MHLGLRKPLFLATCGKFSVHKWYMDRIFPYGHFCVPLRKTDKKIWVPNTGIFSVFQCFVDHRDAIIHEFSIFNYHALVTLCNN